MKKKLKISNDFVNSIITKNNHLTLKILFYAILNGNIKDDGNLVELSVDIREIKKQLKIDFKNLRQNIQKIQKTLITIRDKRNILDLSLIPKAYYDYDKQELIINVFKEVYNELYELKNKFTIIDVNNLLNLQNKHSIRLLTILENINTYDDDFAKTKYFSKDELNTLFDTNYKSVKEIDRAILKKIKDELDEYSKLSFIYDLIYDLDSPNVGRKKIIGIKIYLKDNHQRQLKMF